MTNSDGGPIPDDVLDAVGETCATLTPRIRAKLRELESGQVLEVETDDPAADEGLRAWARLTGHTLVDVRDAGGRRTHFYLRKK